MSVPLILAAVAGVVFNPLVDLLAKRMRRSLAAALVLVLIIVVVLGVVALFVAAIADQGDEIVEGIRSGVTELQDSFEGVIGADRLEDARRSVESLGTVGRDGVAAWLAEAVNSFSGIVAGVALGLVLLYYMLSDYAAIEQWLIRAFSGGRTGLTRRIVEDANETIQSYFRGQTIIALIDAVLIGIAALVIGVPLPGAIALIVFFFAYVPFVGAFLSGALAVLLALSTGDSWRAIAMVAVFLFVNGVIDDLVGPKVQGSAVGLHPLVTLLAVAVGGAAAGIIGAILAVPFTAIAVHTIRLLHEDRDAARGDDRDVKEAGQDRPPEGEPGHQPAGP